MNETAKYVVDWSDQESPKIVPWTCEPEPKALWEDYATSEEVLADWEAGRDFLTQDILVDVAVNLDILPKDMILNIRYDRQREVLPVDRHGAIPEE